LTIQNLSIHSFILVTADLCQWTISFTTGLSLDGCLWAYIKDVQRLSLSLITTYDAPLRAPLHVRYIFLHYSCRSRREWTLLRCSWHLRPYLYVQWLGGQIHYRILPHGPQRRHWMLLDFQLRWPRQFLRLARRLLWWAFPYRLGPKFWVMNILC